VTPLSAMLGLWGQSYLHAVSVALAAGMTEDDVVADIVATIREAGAIVTRNAALHAIPEPVCRRDPSHHSFRNANAAR
jgi:hypothetical protein